MPFPGRHSGWSDAARKKAAESRKKKPRNQWGPLSAKERKSEKLIYKDVDKMYEQMVEASKKDQTRMKKLYGHEANRMA